jgi:Cu/Ag efflux pump CusA
MFLTVFGIHTPLLPLYLDPNTGSFLIQLLAGVLVGGLLAVKIYWRKLVSLFKKTPPAEENEPGDDDFSSPLK